MTNRTKDLIIDAAEVSFAKNGFSLTLLRHITAKAGVNLASVIPMTDGFSGAEGALNLSQSKAELVRHSYSYDFYILTQLCGKGDALYVLKTYSSWV